MLSKKLMKNERDYRETHKTVNTRYIYVARNKLIRREIT